MINKKIWAILVLVLLLIAPQVMAAQESLGVFKQDTCVTLQQNCASCSYVTFNLVTYPDSSELVTNLAATKSGPIYTAEVCNTTQVGQYIVTGTADVDGTDTPFAYDFEVNLIGREKNNSNTSLPIMIFLILLNVGIFLLSLKEDLFQNEYVNFVARRGLIVIAFYFLMYNFTILASLAAAADLPVIGDMLWLMEWSGFIGNIFAIYMFFSTVIVMIKQFKEDKMYERIN